jgi:chorismate synthase
MKIGRFLGLEVFGESHAPFVGMRMTGFPENAAIDAEKLQAFMERRAPGRDENSTARREPDIPEISRYGTTVEAVIRNADTRSGDYEKTVPRPGHADFPSYVKFGRIPAGGGSNSGRLTAPMCAAGGICLQELARRGIAVTAVAERTGDIAAAKSVGDSVGGIVRCTVEGLPVGLGGSMFDGIDGAIAQAIFGIPGVRGIEFGNGFAAAELKGSENNDAFAIRDGKVVTVTNRHGGVLGGMTSGMPLEFRLAMKPTPSIYRPQRSVDLGTMTETELTVRGRHDPCIALRAVPVVEALTAFTVLDFLLESESGISYSAPAKLEHVVIDATVAKLYPKLAENAVYVIPSGEEHKTIETVTKLWSAFARAGIGRKDRVTAIGGGVTGDLAGFAAATWMRGIDWVNVPTTLLSMVDASFGGKTACDLPEGKNLAGAFHPPCHVYIDESFLKTLPERERKSGRAEMVKHEIISGKRNLSLRENLAVKIGIVKADPFEKTGERMKLNCGHTVAHALETATDYAISHGEAVAIGCVEEARLAERMGLAKAGWGDEIAAAFAAEGLPVALPDGLTFESLKPLMKGDKKREGASVVFALPCGWGDVRAVKI